jgi:hypothetical protein
MATHSKVYMSEYMKAMRSDWRELGFMQVNMVVPRERADHCRNYVDREIGESLIELVELGSMEEWTIMANRKKRGTPSYGDIIDLRRELGKRKKRLSLKRVDKFFARFEEYNYAMKRAASPDLDNEEAIAKEFAKAYAYAYWLAAEWWLIQDQV